jgi:hypothetical protein
MSIPPIVPEVGSNKCFNGKIGCANKTHDNSSPVSIVSTYMVENSVKKERPWELHSECCPWKGIVLTQQYIQYPRFRAVEHLLDLRRSRMPERWRSLGVSVIAAVSVIEPVILVQLKGGIVVVAQWTCEQDDCSHCRFTLLESVFVFSWALTDLFKI